MKKQYKNPFKVDAVKFLKYRTDTGKLVVLFKITCHASDQP